MVKEKTAKTSKEKTPEEWRKPLMEAVLDHAGFDGWNQTAINRGADDLGLSHEMAELAFPEGAIEVLKFHLEDADARLKAALDTIDFSDMRIQDRIKTAIKVRLVQNAAHRNAIQRAIAKLSLPIHADTGIRSLENTMDLIWRAIGDTSTDLNWYSKRLTLSGVYLSVLMVWINDESDDFSNTWDFLDHRIDNVMAFEKIKWNLKTKTANMPSLTRFLGRLRYGSS